MSHPVRHALEQVLGYAFADPTLLDLALRHASVAESRVRSNERLEFLGDAVLGMVVCDQVFRTFPDLLEGEMTKIKSAVVSRQSCASMARQIGLVQHLALGKGMRTSPSLPVSLAAATLESVIGAMYIDGGMEPVVKFLLPLIGPRIASAHDSGHQDNYKSLVQQLAQQKGMPQPTYQILSQCGPDHSKTFEICVIMGERRFTAMTGSSKKSAEQLAARKALQELGLLDELGASIRVIAEGDSSVVSGPGVEATLVAKEEDPGEDPGADRGEDRGEGHAVPSVA